jgi:hypothetical protein
MVGDGKTKYDLSTDGKSNEIGGCPSDFRNRGHLTRAKIRYLAHTLLEVSFPSHDNKMKIADGMAGFD